MKTREIKADVLVVGGGMAGITAAVAAAREGFKVVLVEKEGALGGIATSSMLGEMNAFTNNQQKLYGGVTEEIVTNMIQLGFAKLRYRVPMTGNPAIVVDRVGYDPEQFKIYLDDLLISEKISFLLHSTFSNIAQTENGNHKVLITNRYEHISITCEVIIDATGNAEIVFNGGKGNHTLKPSGSEAQAASLIFRMGGIDTALYQTLTIAELRKLILTGYEQGFLPAKYCAINLVPGTKDAIINMTRITSIDYESMLDMTKAEVEGRKQIQHALTYLKRSLPGFGDSYLTVIAPMIGIRDARKIRGLYTLTQKDILAGTKFTEAVAIGCYPVDIHGKTQSVEFTPIGGDGVYTIPYKCLLPIDLKGIIVAGKCISVDEGAFAAIRTIPTVMSIGEAAGIAAALSCKHKVLPDKLSAQEIQSVLQSHGYKF